MPRLGGFTQQFPDVDIRIDSNDKLVDLDDDSNDIAIRYGVAVPDDPALVFSERLVAVYSPAPLAPADLPRFPLIYANNTDTWIALQRENGIRKGDYDFSRGDSNAAVRAQAALAGQGISIVSYTVAYQDILNGSLKMIACRCARISPAMWPRCRPMHR